MQFACLTCTFLTVRSRAAEHSSAAWRRGATFEALDMDGFDYSAPAELFPTRSRKGSRPMAYRRFAKAAEAIRFAIEELSPTHLLGAHLEVEEARFDRDGIRRLYDSEDYPLARRDPPADECAPSTSADEADRSRAR